MTRPLHIGESVAMKSIIAFCTVGLLLFGVSKAQQVVPPSLELPIDCNLANECSIQKYFDHDPGPGRADYACGRLSKDGDTGTDFRLQNYPAMNKGVAVLSAADGVVRAVRDGMDDVSVRDIGHAAIKGREAGNAVVINHGNGWETQYSHLKRDSVRVSVGDHVTSGDALGEVGLSGNTEFPHIEFTLRQNGVAIDPFVGDREFKLCGEVASPIWSTDALSKLPYRPAVVLSSGFHNGPADAGAARNGDYDQGAVNTDAPALVYWADVSGTERGDLEKLVIVDPKGKELVRIDRALEANNISWFVFAGVKRPEKGWPVGAYRAEYTLSRDGEMLAQAAQTMHLHVAQN